MAEDDATAVEPSSWDDGDVLRGREPELEPGTEVGRFVIEEKLGDGGMGVVYAARDTELERRVAVKLVRAPLLGTARNDRAQQRMLREAQAMARISHANVATVYEVGLHGERVFIAMELLDGDTLADWVRAEDRSWRGIRDAFLDAGRGLEAAHAADVIHRDFKPQNVLVGSGGRFVVTDFGLATGFAVDSADDEAEAADGEPGSLTRTGAVLGTPLYMAPEQYARSSDVDARSDQFAFCVALFEALFGQNPFGGGPMSERVGRMKSGDIAMHARSGVPKRLTGALLRGLRFDPGERFGSMSALLKELSYDPAVRSRQLVLGGIAAVATVALATLLYLQLAGGKAAPICEVDNDALAGVWDEVVKRKLAGGLSDSGVADHVAITERVEQNVDAYTEQWKSMAEESCTATRVTGSQSEAELELRAQCLRRRLDDIRGLTAMLDAPTEAVARRAVEASVSMTPMSACADLVALSAPVELPEDPTARDRVERMQRALAAAKSLRAAGQYQPALEAARAVLDSEHIGIHEPLHAEVLQLVGEMEARTGAKPQAVETLRAAANHAEASGHDEALARTRIELAHVAGYLLADQEAGALWIDLAQATIKRLADRRDLLGYLELSRGAIAYRRADYEGAARSWKLSVDHLSAGLGDDHVDVARALNNLGMVSSKLGRAADAEAFFGRSLGIRERLLGPDHLLVANTLTNMAGHFRRAGEHDKALAAYERSAAIREVVEPDAAGTAGVIMSLAMVHMDAKRYEKSLAQLHRALAVYERSRTVRQGDLDYPHVLGTIANVLREQGKLDESQQYYERAIAALAESGDAEHERAGAIYVGMGMTLSDKGDQAGAIGYFERTLGPWEAMSPDHLNLGYPLTGIGVAHLRAKHPAEAIAPLERALAIRTKHEGRGRDLAETQHALAQALWDSGGDRERARELATAALAELQALDGQEDARAGTVADWLEAHPL